MPAAGAEGGFGLADDAREVGAHAAAGHVQDDPAVVDEQVEPSAVEVELVGGVVPRAVVTIATLNSGQARSGCSTRPPTATGCCSSGRGSPARTKPSRRRDSWGDSARARLSAALPAGRRTHGTPARPVAWVDRHEARRTACPKSAIPVHDPVDNRPNPCGQPCGSPVGTCGRRPAAHPPHARSRSLDLPGTWANGASRYAQAPGKSDDLGPRPTAHGQRRPAAVRGGGRWVR